MKRPDFIGIHPDVAEYFTSLEDHIEDITQMLQNLQRLYFGRKTEKIRIPAMEDGVEQLSTFTQDDPAPVLLQPEAEIVEVSSHGQKKKCTQEEIIVALPVTMHEHALPPEQRICPHCGKEELKYVGKELVFTEYVRVPVHIDRHEHYVEKCACLACENGTAVCESCDHTDTEACAVCSNKPVMIVIATEQPEEFRHPLIAETKSSPSIVAQIYYDKIALALPEYRQEKEWKHLGFPLSRQTMSSWILRLNKDYLQPLTKYMLKMMKSVSSVAHCAMFFGVSPPLTAISPLIFWIP